MRNRVRSRIYEGARLTLESVQAVAFPLYAILTSTTTSGTDAYSVPNSKKLVVTDVLPHVATTVPSGESAGFGLFQYVAVTAATLFTAGSPRDRLFAKAMNARLQLEISNSAIQLFDKHTFAMSALLDPDSTFDDEFPLVVPGGGQLALTAQLQDSTASGTSSLYGVLIVGALIPAEA